MPQDHDCYEALEISFGNPNYSIETEIPMTRYNGGQKIHRLRVKSKFTELRKPQKGQVTFDINDWSSPPTKEVLKRLKNLQKQGLDVTQKPGKDDEFWIDFTVTEEDENFICAAWRVTDALLIALGAKNAFNSHPEMIRVTRYFFFRKKWRTESDYLLLTHGKNPHFQGIEHKKFAVA